MILFYILCCLNTNTRVNWCPVSWRPFISNALSNSMVVSGGTVNPALVTLSWPEASYDYLLYTFYVVDWNWEVKSPLSVTSYWQPPPEQRGLEFHSCFSGHLSVILITSKNWLLGFLIVLYINIYVNIWYSFYLLFLRPVLIKCWMWLIIDRYLLGIHVILWLS